MYSFYPGPSQVWENVPVWTNQAYNVGILGQNHRSLAFQDLYKNTVQEFRRVHNLPSDYYVFFTSSATECWEIVAQSVILGARSLHVGQGDFAQKWYDYTQRLSENAHYIHIDQNTAPIASDIVREVKLKPKVVALTHTETSTGSTLPNFVFSGFRKEFPEAIIAVDATSSMGGVAMPWQEADIWFASVQKCFGLPAGLSILICSPKAINSTYEQKFYNSLNFMAKNAEEWQTTHTPNTLGIYLLYRSLLQQTNITIIEENLKKEAVPFYQLLSENTLVSPVIENAALRSATVVALRLSEPYLSTLKRDALAQNFLLGNGYGDWKKNTFRIANFPAMPAIIKQNLQFFIKEWLRNKN